MLVNDELFHIGLMERNLKISDTTDIEKRFKKSDMIKDCELEINYKNIK